MGKSIVFFVAIVLFVSLKVKGQSKSPGEYFNLKEALLNPEKVKKLDLSGQLFETFPLEVFKFNNLEYLSFRNDHLKSVPKEIAFLTKLKVLDLGGNDFKTLPQDFSTLRNLEELFLDNEPNLNFEESIFVISKLPKLKSLHLDNDHLSSLPKNFSLLKNIENLYLGNNDLKYMPKEILGLKNLKTLDLLNNPIIKNNDFRIVENYGIRIKF